MMTPQEIDSLRKEIKKRLVDLDMDRTTAYSRIIPHLKVPASRQILCNALTGYRNGPAAQALLLEMKEILSVWPPYRVSPCGEHIHEGATQNN